MAVLSLKQRSEPSIGIMTRSEAVEEFQYRHQPGEHVLFLGPTGRGKTTLAASLLAQPATDDALIVGVKGKDPALARLGKPVKTWPRQQRWKPPFSKKEDPPRIYRYEASFRKESDLVQVRDIVSRTFTWLWAQHDWTIYVPDLQVVSDPKMMGLGKQLEALLLTARSRGTSIWMDAQAPRWIPSAANDQTSHLLIFKNRDRRTVQRLREIAGLDMNIIEDVMDDMAYHAALWIDVIRDEYYHILEK